MSISWDTMRDGLDNAGKMFHGTEISGGDDGDVTVIKTLRSWWRDCHDTATC